MNRIYLFGKIISKSKLKYIIEPKLKVYVEIVIETISRDKFYCVMYEDKCDLIKNIKLKKYVLLQGFGVMVEDKFKIYTNEIYC